MTKKHRAVLILIDKGGILLLYRFKNGEEYYVFPGGGVEDAESIIDAAVREAKEEIGVNVELKKLVGYTEYLSERKLRGWGHSICFEFLVRIKSGKLKGSKQGEKFGIFKTAPANTIAEQKRFLRKMKFLR